MVLDERKLLRIFLVLTKKLTRELHSSSFLVNQKRYLYLNATDIYTIVVGKLNKMKFKSRKDILFQLLGFSIIGFFVGIVLFSMFSDGIENYIFKWTDIFMLVVVGFLIWFGLGTNYELTQTELKYKSGPIKGKIDGCVLL